MKIQHNDPESCVLPQASNLTSFRAGSSQCPKCTVTGRFIQGHHNLGPQGPLFLPQLRTSGSTALPLPQRRGGLTRDGFEKKLQNRGSPIRLSLQSPSWLLGIPAHSLPPIYFSLNLLEISSRTVAGKASQAPQQRRATSPRTPSKEGTPAGPAGLLQLDVAHLMLAVSTTVSKLRATGLAWVHLSCHVNQQVAASRKPHPADQVTVTKAASMAT